MKDVPVLVFANKIVEFLTEGKFATAVCADEEVGSVHRGMFEEEVVNDIDRWVFGFGRETPYVTHFSSIIKR